MDQLTLSYGMSGFAWLVKQGGTLTGPKNRPSPV